MKVFISHSSRDKWISRRISRDLEVLGAETFLDEKDLSTGDSIDAEIHGHLRECEELLLLLSPTALASNWVMIEVGGARALGLRLCPILLHVGANEVPEPISHYLLRDINEIERYYEEIEKRMGGAHDDDIVALRTPPPQIVTYSEGDRVEIIGGRTTAIRRGQVYLDWIPEMEPHRGTQATVCLVGTDGTVTLDGLPFWWAIEWLRLASD